MFFYIGTGNSSAYSNIFIDLLGTGFPKVYKFTIGPEGSSRWPKATSPPQELEVGTRRAPYLLVFSYLGQILALNLFCNVFLEIHLYCQVVS